MKFLLEKDASLRGLDGIQGIIFCGYSSQEPIWALACLYSEGLKTKFPTLSLNLLLCSEFALKMIYHTVCVDGNRLLILREIVKKT